MQEAAATAAPTLPTPPITTATATSRRASYLLTPFLVVLALGSAGLGSMWERQQLTGSLLSVLPSISTTAFLRSSFNSSSSISASPASSSLSSSGLSSPLAPSSLTSSFLPTCDYPFYQRQNASCPRFVNIDLIAARGLGDRFLQFCMVLLVALDTSSIPVLLDMHTAPGSHGNYTGLEDFLPIGQSLPTIEEVREQYPNLHQIRSGWPGSYRDKIAWLIAGGPKKQPTETGKEDVKQEENEEEEEEEKVEGDPGCNLLMTVDMDVCGDYRGEGCYYLDEPQYTRLKDLLRCWLLRMNPDTIPRLVWEDGREGGKEGGVVQVGEGQQKCYNVAIHLRVGDTLLHETDNMFFENLKRTVGVALVGFECVHYHFFYEEEAMIRRDKEEEKQRMEAMLKVEEEAKEKEGADLVKKEEKAEKRWKEGEPPFSILPEIFKEEVVVVEEAGVVEEDRKEKERTEEEREGRKKPNGAIGRNDQTRTIRKQHIRVSYHGKMDIKSALYHLMDADMLVSTGSSFPYMAALLSPKPVILFGTPKEARTGGGRPQTNGWVGGYWFGGYAVGGGNDAAFALLTDEGKVVSPETDTEWRAMVEMKYLDAAGRRVPYV